MPNLVTRRMTEADIPLVHSLIRDLAEYEREPDAVVATEDDLRREGFGPAPSFEVLIASDGDEPVGFALYFFTYSTWLGRRCLHLEDLFVRPAARGRGAGLMLMRAVARVAVERGCGRFTWQVLDWNTPAIGFYEKLGASIQRQWLAARLEGDAIAQLAAHGDE